MLSNFLIPARMLTQAGLHPWLSFRRVEFLQGHDLVARAVYDGTVALGAGHDGVITTLALGSIVLKERNGDLVPIQIASTATVAGRGGRTGSAALLRRGMRVTVFRLANAPADTIQVEGFGG